MNTAKIFKWVGTGIAAIFTIVVLGLVSLEFFINDSYVARTVTKIAEKSPMPNFLSKRLILPHSPTFRTWE